MVITGVVDDHDDFAAGLAATALEFLQEVPAGLGIEHSLGA